MSSNYGLILVVLTFVSGIIWLIDAFTTGKKRKAAVAKLYEQTKNPSQEAIDAVSREPIHVDYSKSFFPILLFIVVLRSFLYEPFQIPSASMKPTFTEGDFILVNKYNYGLRLPVTSQKILEIGSPQRGDIAVFRAPHNPEQDYIKRVVGLPGDTVFFTEHKDIIIQPFCEPIARQNNSCPETYQVKKELKVGEVYIDKNPVTEDFTKNQRYTEFLGEKTHDILINPLRPERRKRYPRNIPVEEVNVTDKSYPVLSHKYVVPQGHYFVMGDNRDNSEDARYWQQVNFVPEENLVGRAFLIWMHLDFGIKNKYFRWVPTNIDFGRVGTVN